MSEKSVERYGFQVWQKDVDGEDEIVRDGFAQAKGLDRAVEMVRNVLQKDHPDFESLGWVVWLEKDNRIYQEFKGSQLVAGGGGRGDVHPWSKVFAMWCAQNRHFSPAVGSYLLGLHCLRLPGSTI